jgi:hypothetical protein
VEHFWILSSIVRVALAPPAIDDISLIIDAVSLPLSSEKVSAGTKNESRIVESRIDESPLNGDLLEEYIAAGNIDSLLEFMGKSFDILLSRDE